ncbi:anthranilate phosphoribosyltransferase [Neobacillus piezotolerans]|uniref:Anthranilate phosphoribosyltransferase n=1 Tax=Neobacillus piezotolerans TaxID=2259171 RepID=A0A3D8GQ76_9BACI|nr:anthranilate phosphoribosyltransferase [Neobacillus piezotolerans]RDU36477.1 anthranilate phosphoribosyltransferase [Neobacillus piezotolerans]
MKEYLLRLSERVSLSEIEMKDAIGNMLNGEAEETEIAAFLMALKMKGETPEELAGMAEALKANSLGFGKQVRDAMDNCGTGGDGASTFNVSTTSAFVIAGAGVKVAKHGNRSISSKTGSADVLEHLGIHLDIPPAVSQEILEELGISFLFAQHVHPKLKKIIAVRKQMKIPTAFNMIGPLSNPIDLEYQLVGVYKPEFIPLFAKTLKVLGRKRAIVINGKGSLDEASLEGENQLAILEDGVISYVKLYPEEAGLRRINNSEIRGGSAGENAKILMDVLSGKESPYRETVLLNAGLGIFAARRAKSIIEGIDMARRSIDSGAAYKKLEGLRNISDRIRKEAI